MLSEGAISNPYGSGNSTECLHYKRACCAQFLNEKPYGIRTSRETQRNAERRKCTSCVYFLRGEAMWNPFESGNSTECGTSHCTCCVRLLSGQDIWNPSESGSSVECKTPQMHLLCAPPQRRSHVEWNLYEPGDSKLCQTRALHLLCTISWRRSRLESVRVRKLKGVPNTANAPPVRPT